MARLASLSLGLLVAGCGNDDEFKRIGGQGLFHFVWIREDAGQKEFRAAADAICGTAPVCLVRFWVDRRLVATALPMSDEQVAGIIAAYSRNRMTRVDVFSCHPFGQPGERCAKF